VAREPPHNGFPAESLFELSGTLPSYPLLYAAGAVVGWHANLLLRGLPYSSRQRWAWDPSSQPLACDVCHDKSCVVPNAAEDAGP